MLINIILTLINKIDSHRRTGLNMSYSKLKMSEYNISYRDKSKMPLLCTGDKVKVTWFNSKQLGKVGTVSRKGFGKKSWVNIDGAEYLFLNIFLEKVLK